MGPRPRAHLTLALLLLPALAAPVLGQPEPAPTEALPGEVLAVAQGWVDHARARTADLRAQAPVNAASPDAFAASAQRFVNASQLTLAMTQAYQANVANAFLEFNRTVPEDEATRRAALLERVGGAENASRAGWEAFVERLRAYEGGARTTHGLEYATLAVLAGLEAEADLAALPQAAERLRNQSQRVGDDMVLLTIFVTEAPGAYLRFAGDLLDLAARADRDAGRPQLQEGALEALHEQVQKRFLLDPEASSLVGPLSTNAAGAVDRANRTGPRLLHLGRFVVFQQARAMDAIDFLVSRSGAGAEEVRALVATALANASLVPRYDARLVDEPSPVPRMQHAGYQGVVVVDARNHAAFRVTEDPSLEGARQGWAALVAATYAADALAEARGGRPAGLDGNLALYGGIAVAVALVVVAVGLLRK